MVLLMRQKEIKQEVCEELVLYSVLPYIADKKEQHNRVQPEKY